MTSTVRQVRTLLGANIKWLVSVGAAEVENLFCAVDLRGKLREMLLSI